MSDWHTTHYGYRDNSPTADRDDVADAVTMAGMQIISSDAADKSADIEAALVELRDNFEFSEFHEERVRKLLQNDESLLDDLNHLVIAASVMISDAAEMKSGGLKAYEMGDQIIVEEEQDDGWQVVRTLGVQVVQILAHARAKKRIEQLEDLVGGLGEDRTDRIKDYEDPLDDIFDDPNDGGGITPQPTPIPDPDPMPNPYEPHWIGTGNGTWYTVNSDELGDDDLETLLNQDIKEVESRAKIRDL